MRDFASQGLPTEHPLLHKLWLVAKIQGHRNPFHPDLRTLNYTQIDFILEMAAKDEPDSYVFNRGGAKASASEINAAWYAVHGAAAARRSKVGRSIAEAQSRLAARRQAQFGERLPGFTRGGKTISEGDV